MIHSVKRFANPLKIAALLFWVAILPVASLYGQPAGMGTTANDAASMRYRDTLGFIVMDSFLHNFGNIAPVDHNNTRVVKHFKYIGSDSVFITRTWTSDPHFICQFSKERLIPQVDYTLTICFAHRGRQGIMHKTMGFDLSDGTRIVLQFKGYNQPAPAE
jgi:hypothetical protein